MNDIITVTDATNDTPLYSDNLIQVAEQAEKRVTAVNKIKALAIRVTNTQDWVDQGGKPYLQVSGAEKIARLFGISWRIDEPQVEHYEDGHFAYTYKGYFSMAGQTIEVIGTRSSKDGFFKKYSGKGEDRKELPPSEIDRGDVKKSCYTNLLGNGITRLLGLRNMTWDEVKSAGITQSQTSRVQYNNSEMSDDAKDQRAKIGEMLLELADNDKDQASSMLKEITSFTGKDGKVIVGKSSLADLSEKAITVTYGKVKKMYEERSK